MTMKLYLYGIIDSSEQITESLYGLEGASICNVPFRDIGAIASEINRPIEEVTENAVLEHDAVVEGMMAVRTVLPVRFGTIIDGRDNLLSMMQDYYGQFKENLDRLRNKFEFGVKVIWPGNKVKENIVTAFKKSGQKIPVPDGSAGKRFMKEKFREHRIDEEFKKRADRFIKIVDLFFGRFAAEEKVEKLKTENLLVDAVYLVEKNKRRDFREAFEHIRSAHPNLKYLFSGPWPPYNFVVLSKKPVLLWDPERACLSDKTSLLQDPVGVDHK